MQPDPLPDGTYVFRARSFSRRRGLVHRVRVNPETGSVSCTCRDFFYRKRFEGPTFRRGPWCKHLQRAIRTVLKLRRDAPQRMPEAA